MKPLDDVWWEGCVRGGGDGEWGACGFVYGHCEDESWRFVWLVLGGGGGGRLGVVRRNFPCVLCVDPREG